MEPNGRSVRIPFGKKTLQEAPFQDLGAQIGPCVADVPFVTKYLPWIPSLCKPFDFDTQCNFAIVEKSVKVLVLNQRVEKPKAD